MASNLGQAYRNLKSDLTLQMDNIKERKKERKHLLNEGKQHTMTITKIIHKTVNREVRNNCSNNIKIACVKSDLLD